MLRTFTPLPAHFYHHLLPILFADEHYIAVYKPAGMLVHRSKIAADVRHGFVLQMLRDQLGGRHLYPIHRIDRPTAGVLLLAMYPQAAAQMVALFAAQAIQKTYLAIVRGYTAPQATIDYALRKYTNNALQDAQTSYRCLHTTEQAFAVGRYPTARYSLLQLQPHTGRMHQLRRHLKHIFHPIVGDTRYGDLHHNRAIAAHYPAAAGLQLLAHRLSFVHPFSQQQVLISAPPPPPMQHLMQAFGWSLHPQHTT